MFNRLFRYDGEKGFFNTDGIEPGYYLDLMHIVGSISDKTGLHPVNMVSEQEFERMTDRRKATFADPYVEALQFIDFWQPKFLAKFDELEQLTTQWSNKWYIRGPKGDTPQARADDLFAGCVLDDEPEKCVLDMIELLDAKIMYHKAQNNLHEVEGSSLKEIWERIKYVAHSRLVVDDRQEFEEIVAATQKLNNRVAAYYSYFREEGIIDLESPLKDEAAKRIHRLTTEEINTLVRQMRNFTGRHIETPAISAYEPAITEPQQSRC